MSESSKPSGQPRDPRVGLNPTGRPRKSSAASRRKNERRDQNRKDGAA